MDKSQWVDIKGFEGIYQININEKVRRISHLIGDKNAVNEIKIRFDKSKGYKVADLTLKGKSKAYGVHRLLAIAFIPNPNDYPFVRHLNDIRIDNRLINLAWGTRKDNMEDAVKNGRMAKPKGPESKCYGKTRPYAKHARKIEHVESGNLYYGCGEAAKAIGINANTLRCKLNGFGKNDTGLIFAQ